MLKPFSTTIVLFITFFFGVKVAASIPIDKGRQLFVDDYLIKETNLKTVFYTPNYYSGNPILKADKNWEMNIKGDPYAAPFSGGVWYDELQNKYKMWYSAGGRKRNGLITCYAESDDGKNWIKPNLDMVQGTNIVDTTEHDCVSVILDKFETDPSKKYKMFIVGFVNDRSVVMYLKYSSDGIHWSAPAASSGELYDRCSAYFNPFTKKYVLSLKTLNGKYRRARNYLENTDPELLVSLAHRTFDTTSDKYIKYWFHVNDDDPRHPNYANIRPQIYNHEAMPYESQSIGYFTIWQGPENNVCDSLNIQKRNEVLIGWTRDGFNWNRKNKSPFLPVSTNPRAWNAGNVQSTNGNPLIVGDSLFFYVSGRHESKPIHDSNFSTGLAMLRRDGFASVQASKKEGFLTTKLLSFDGKYLFVNTEVEKGKLAVELIDENDNVIKGFSKKECKIIQNLNSTKQVVAWKSNTDLSALKGRNIRLKFYLTNGNLYSFWISPWQTGESRGYTAGGGPGLSTIGIDTK